MYLLIPIYLTLFLSNNQSENAKFLVISFETLIDHRYE